MIDLTGRQSDETKLRESIEELRETIKSTYERKVHERVQGGVQGAGHFSSTFLSVLGFGNLAKSVKENAEAKEMDRQSKEAFVQNFQENTPAGQILSKSTAREAAYGQYQGASEESKIEDAEGKKEALEKTTKMSEDMTALYTISDDYFKAQMKHNEEMKKLFERIEISLASGAGGGGSLLGSAADLLGGGKGGAGKAAGKVGRLASMAGKLGTVAKVGGGLLAVGTAAYDAYGDYSEADRQVQAGEITQKEGQVKKGEAVGGGVGAAGGALAGAKAGAMLGAFGGPVGMAIGGLLGGAAGYLGGKYIGKKVGGGAVQGVQALSGPGETPAAPMASETPAAATPTPAPAATAAPAAAPAAQQSAVTPKRIQFNPDGTRKPTAAEVLRGEVPPPPAAPVVERPTPAPAPAAPAPAAAVQTPAAAAATGADGETYDNRSALTGFTKEYLQGIVDGTVSGAPIGKSQAEDYLSKIQPGEKGYKKKFMRGKPVLAPSSSAPAALPAEPATLSAPGGELTAKTVEVAGAKDNMAAGSTNVNSVNAPVTNVVNNNTQESTKSSRNEETTFQRFVDRRYSPLPSF